MTGLFTRTVGRGAFWCRIANNLNVELAHLAELSPVLRYAYLAAIRGADAVCALTPYQRDLLADEHENITALVDRGYNVNETHPTNWPH